MHTSRIAALFTTALLAACSEKAREKPAPSPPTPATTAPAQAKAEAAPTPAATARSEGGPCYEVTPYFNFDSTEPLLSKPNDLRDLAQCLNERLEDGETVTLIGHTDARGRQAYNVALGRERAERVRELLTAYGLAADRIRVQSAGERDAMERSSGRTSWKGRRVDIVRSDQRITHQ